MKGRWVMNYLIIWSMFSSCKSHFYSSYLVIDNSPVTYLEDEPRPRWNILISPKNSVNTKHGIQSEHAVNEEEESAEIHGFEYSTEQPPLLDFTQAQPMSIAILGWLFDQMPWVMIAVQGAITNGRHMLVVWLLMRMRLSGAWGVRWTA